MTCLMQDSLSPFEAVMNCSKRHCSKGAVTVLPVRPGRVVGACEEHEAELLADLGLVERMAERFYQGRTIPEHGIVPLPTPNEVKVLADKVKREKRRR